MGKFTLGTPSDLLLLNGQWIYLKYKNEGLGKKYLGFKNILNLIRSLQEPYGNITLSISLTLFYINYV